MFFIPRAPLNIGKVTPILVGWSVSRLTGWLVSLTLVGQLIS